jgi:hypothetical protein
VAVACTRLYLRGVLERSPGGGTGLKTLRVTSGDLGDCHPLERAVATNGSASWEDLRRFDEMDGVRQRLEDQGLIARAWWTFRAWRRTSAGEKTLAAARCLEDESEDAEAKARRVATEGASAVASVAPRLAHALGLIKRPRRGSPLSKSAVIARGTRRHLKRRRGGFANPNYKDGIDAAIDLSLSEGL